MTRAVVLALVLGVALWEAASALRAPSLVPTEADWQAAAREVRAGFRSLRGPEIPEPRR